MATMKKLSHNKIPDPATKFIVLTVTSLEPSDKVQGYAIWCDKGYFINPIFPTKEAAQKKADNLIAYNNREYW